MFFQLIKSENDEINYTLLAKIRAPIAVMRFLPQRTQSKFTARAVKSFRSAE